MRKWSDERRVEKGNASQLNGAGAADGVERLTAAEAATGACGALRGVDVRQCSDEGPSSRHVCCSVRVDVQKMRGPTLYTHWRQYGGTLWPHSFTDVGTSLCCSTVRTAATRGVLIPVYQYRQYWYQPSARCT